MMPYSFGSSASIECGVESSETLVWSFLSGSAATIIAALAGVANTIMKASFNLWSPYPLSLAALPISPPEK